MGKKDENVTIEEENHDGGEIELQTEQGDIGVHFSSQIEIDPEEEAFKSGEDEEENLEFKYSRATNREIHYGKYIPLFKDKDGIPTIFIGPDCK